MPDEKYNRSLIIDTNALFYQLAYWIDVRIEGKKRLFKDSRVSKAHDIISKYSKKHITSTIKSEFFDGDEVKPVVLMKIRDLLGIKSRLALMHLLDKPLSKLKERIKEISVCCLQSDLDSVASFYSDIISTLNDEDEERWKKGYGLEKPLMPEENDRKILAECINMEDDVSLVSNDRAFVFPKFKEKIESEYKIIVEDL